MRDFLLIAKALADQNRLRALCALRRRDLCVCQIVELLGLAPSTVSKHMSVLRQARLVEARKDGRWMHYRLGGDDAPAAVQEALTWARQSLVKSPQVLQDAKRLKEILRMDREELCRRQAEARGCCPA